MTATLVHCCLTKDFIHHKPNASKEQFRKYDDKVLYKNDEFVRQVYEAFTNYELVQFKILVEQIVFFSNNIVCKNPNRLYQYNSFSAFV